MATSKGQQRKINTAESRVGLDSTRSRAVVQSMLQKKEMIDN